MSEHNNHNKRSNKDKRKIPTASKLKVVLISILILLIISGGVVGGVVLSMVKAAPEIDPERINASLSHTSSILDIDGNLIEKIETAEFRTFVNINQMPQHLLDAFIAIEDERFYEHSGVDPKGIVSAAMENLKSDGIVRGASTITQQLVKNVYLSPDKKWSRKIQEAYLALKVDKALSKDQILEAYLNRNFFGQNAYGVQEAAQTYFSKDVEDLSLAESALFAGIIKSTQQYQPYVRVRPEDFDSSKHYEVGETDILGEKYILVFNENSVARQKIVLKKMLDLGKISESEYKEALDEDIKANLKPGQHRTTDITSYFTDYVKSEVMEKLVSQLGYTKEQAEEELFSGGLQIYSTVDIDLQKELEDVYNNFTEILVGNTAHIRGPILISWRLDGQGNVIDERNKIIYYRQNNIFDEDYNLIIEKGTYEITDNGDMIIDNQKIDVSSNVNIANYYRIDDKKNLVTHDVGTLSVPENKYEINDDQKLIISKEYLDENDDFYSTDGNGNLLINEKYFYRSEDGVVQPQSASVIMDYRTGHLKGIIGGRDVHGSRVLNRATDSKRQPGSAIKPLSVYMPALDNGYTAASAIDDIPHYNHQGELWPKNWYTGYRGIHTLRASLEQSINVNSVKTLEDIGIGTSMKYLEQMGIINKENPELDNFVTSSESADNDENPAALGLGGMTNGLTPLEMTAAFGVIANDGVYVEPISFTKVLDKNGNILIDNTPRETTIVSPQQAYILKDILRTTVSNGIASRARMSNMAVAGKTGTTQRQADIWFVGFTPYYVSGTWIGNDSPVIALSQGSTAVAGFWQHIMTRIHKNLDPRPSFPRPDGIVSASICTQSGLLPTSLCSKDPRHVVRTEIFAKGTVPSARCDVHVEVKIDKSTGKIATEYCPKDKVAAQVFVQRNPTYNPSDHNGITPSDFQYTAPTQVCDKHDKYTRQDEDKDKDKDEDDEKDRDNDIINDNDNGSNGDNDGNGDDDDNGNNSGNDNDNGDGDGNGDDDDDDDDD